jgi:hypothetical protein
MARKCPNGRAEGTRRGGGKASPGKAAGASRERRAGQEKARAYARELSEKERVALAVRDELYDGSWEHMREDLEARREGRTYVFRLASRIEEDIRTIRRLSAFERRHSVNLSEYLQGAAVADLGGEEGAR